MRLLTVTQVAEALQVEEDTVRRLARGGRLPGAARLSGRWRFEAAAFEGFCRGLVALEAERQERDLGPGGAVR